MRQWLRETHGVKFELVRHFLARMFDSDLFSAAGQWQTVAVSAFATIFPAALLFGNYGAKYGRLSRLASPVPFRSAAVADELSLLVLVMALSGLVALMQWQSLFPGKRDYFALAALPIRSRQIFISRFIAVFIFITGVIVTANLLPSIAIPIQIEGRWAKNPSLLVNVWAYAAAACLACYFVFVAVMALQGLLLHVLPRRIFARLSVYVQGLGMAVFFLAALFSWTIGEWQPSMVAQLPNFGRWAPPVWFVGLHEWLLGDRDPFFTAMKSRALIGFAVAAAVTLLTYLAGYKRYRQLLVEVPDDVEAPRHSRWSLLRLIAPDPRAEAVMQFMAKTLARSRVHRVVLLGYLGLGVGLAANSIALTRAPTHLHETWYEALQFAVLFWPLAITAVILPGFRHACSMPAELRANWIFRSTEAIGRAAWMAGVERFIVVCIIGPIYLVLAPIAISVLGWELALRMIALQILVSLTMFEVLFGNWQKLPFTCSYTPGKRPLMEILARALAGLGVLVPLLTLAIRAASFLWAIFFVYAPFFVGAWWWARRRRLDGWGEVKLIYEDVNETVPQLGISELSYRPSESLETSSSAPDLQAVSYLGSGGSSGSGDSESARQRPPIATSLRLYRAIANVFPQEFKDAYGDELLQVTEDAVESIWQRHRRFGLLRLLADVTLRVASEHVSQFGRDLRYGLRSLTASPGFTAVAVVSLTLAICIATCSFSEMNGMVLRVVPGLAQPRALVGLQAPVSYPDYKRYRELSDVFSSTMAYAAPVRVGIAVDRGNEHVWGHLVTSSYFSTLGVQPLLGFAFGPQDDEPGAPPAAVISYRFWQGHLGGDENIIGKTLRINGHAVTIVGVGPKDFFGASPALFASDVWMPLFAGEQVAPELADHVLEQSDRNLFHVVGRLQPGVTNDAAEARLDALARQIERDKGRPDNPDRARRITLVAAGKLLPLRKQDLPFFTSFFLTLAALVVLIACANVANMMLARTARRRREIAVRLAIGASRARIIRELLTESMLIAAAAGIAGFILSTLLMRAASQLRMPLPIPVSYDLTVDGRVFAFTLGVTTLTGLIFGLAPAWHATHVSLSPALKEGGNIQLHRFRRVSLRNLLMVAQVAASLTLLVVVGLMSVGIQSTIGVQQGFDPKDLYLVALDPVRDGVPAQQAQEFFPKFLERVRALPGVTSACLTDTLPVAMNLAPWVRFSLPGSGAEKIRVHGAAAKQVVGNDYFETNGIHILEGRSFSRQDEADSASAIIVSATFVRYFMAGLDPVGQRLRMESGENTAPTGAWPGDPDFRRGILAHGPKTFEIVGVAADVTNSVLAQDEHPAIYFPLRPSDYVQPSLQGTTLIVRVTSGTDAVRLVENELAVMDNRITPFDARSMQEHVHEFMTPLRAASWTYGVIGIFGLALAGVGLAGVTAYSVSQRNHEIGVRMALGARARNVLALVMKEGAMLVAIGSAIGMVGAFAASRALSAMNSSVGTVTSTSTTNPLVTFGAPILLAALAMIACYLPARRSLRVDPMIALRQE